MLEWFLKIQKDKKQNQSEEKKRKGNIKDYDEIFMKKKELVGVTFLLKNKKLKMYNPWYSYFGEKKNPF